MKYVLTIFAALTTVCCLAQQSKFYNRIDSFAVKNALGLDISIIGRMVTLDEGVYHPEGDYLSFLIPQEKEFWGIKTKYIWYQFSKTTLTKLCIIFKTDEAAGILPDMMAEFSDFSAKDPITKSRYWRGKNYNIQFTIMDDKYRALTITLAKQWPVWKETQMQKE